MREGFAASFEMLAELDPSGASTSDRKCECASMWRKVAVRSVPTPDRMIILHISRCMPTNVRVWGLKHVLCAFPRLATWRAHIRQAFASMRPIVFKADNYFPCKACCSACMNLPCRACTHPVIWWQSPHVFRGSLSTFGCLHSGSMLFVNSHKFASVCVWHLALCSGGCAHYPHVCYCLKIQ